MKPYERLRESPSPTGIALFWSFRMKTEFGYTVWQVQVPLAKIFFFNGLLPNSILKGEGEFMVIGGEYRVRMVTW
jgi:hypothetical protein